MSDQADQTSQTDLVPSTDADVDQTLPEDVQAILAEALEAHRQLPQAQAHVDALIAARNAKVIRLRARGLSGYRLHRLFQVSQTTIGNWTNQS